MPFDELKGWGAYFNKRPAGWQDDNRTYLQLRAQGVKEAPENVFQSLRQLKILEEKKQVTHAEALKGSSFLVMLNAVAARNGVDWKVE